MIGDLDFVSQSTLGYYGNREMGKTGKIQNIYFYFSIMSSELPVYYLDGEHLTPEDV